MDSPKYVLPIIAVLLIIIGFLAPYFFESILNNNNYNFHNLISSIFYLLGLLILFFSVVWKVIANKGILIDFVAKEDRNLTEEIVNSGNFVETIRELVSNGKLEKAIFSLRKYLERYDDYKDRVILIANSYALLKSKLNFNVLDHKTSNIENNNIAFRILELLKDLEKNEK